MAGYVVKTEKRVDTQNAPKLDAELKALIEKGVYNFTVDMSDTAYISSAALRVFLSAQKKVSAKGGDMQLVNVGPVVMEVFDVTGFSGILNIAEQ